MKLFPYDVPKASRQAFWRKLIQSMNEKSSLCRNISPSDRQWVRAGLYGSGLTFVATGYYGRAELYIDRRGRKEHEFIYDALMAHRQQIEKDFGGPLVWERLDNKSACRIKTERSGNVFDEREWDTMREFMVSSMLKLEAVMEPWLAKLHSKLQ